jgi:YebC/PmpR family DNA-binding regulatory protein
MSGHNKWSQIKHKKAKEDSKRGYAFTKLIKEITAAARAGGGDPAGNPRLRVLLDKAKEINMPIDNSNRAIKRGTGELPGVHYEEFTYEGYGPGGIAIVMDTLSDNKNRTVASLRHLFSKMGGTLAESGAVSWMFEKKGVLRATGTNISEDELIETLLEYDIKDIRLDDKVFTIIGDPKQLESIKQALAHAGLHIEHAAIEWVAKAVTELDDTTQDTAVDFLSALQDHEDVQNVYTNLA